MATSTIKQYAEHIRVFRSEIKNFKNLADKESVTCTLDLPEDVGIGLVIYNLAHCGNSKQAGGYWMVNSMASSYSRSYIAISQPTTWDNSVTYVDIMSNISAGSKIFTFTNYTGATTDPTYDSRVFVTVIKLK